MPVNLCLQKMLLFADDTVFMTHNHQHAQEMITRFSKSAKVFVLKINLKKTEIMCRLPPSFFSIGQDIQIDGQLLTPVNKFQHLGSIVANKRLDAELDTRTSNSSKAG